MPAPYPSTRPPKSGSAMPARPVRRPGPSNDEEIERKFPLLYAGAEPDVEAQFDEFKRAGGIAISAVARDFNERIRYNRWKGRTSDYRKHRKAINADPVPWEGAWDGRVYLADNVIEDLGDVCSSAFERAQLKCKGTEVSDLERAAIWDNILGYYRGQMRSELRDEAEYLWQFGLNSGQSVFQVGWNYHLAMKNQRVSLEQLATAAQMAMMAIQQMPPQEVPPEVAGQAMKLMQFNQAVLDPAMEPVAIDLLKTFARDIAGQLYTKQREQYGDEFLQEYELSTAKARQVVRELRNRGHSALPVPYVSSNRPCVVARELGFDYFCPPEMTGLQDSPWHAVREWLTPEEVFANVLCEGWDADWAEEAVKTAGQSSYWGDMNPTSDTGSGIATDDEVDSYDWQAQQSKNGLVEIIHFYKRYITPERVSEIWCTVWCPHAVKDPRNPTQELFAKHYQFEDLPNQYPFAGFRWQKKKRAFCAALGVPQIVGADQWAVKTSIDMLMDLEAMSVLPERYVREKLGLRFKTGPGAQITRKFPGDIEQIEPPSGHPELAFNLVEMTMKRVSNYFGLMNEHVLPAKWQGKLQRLVERYLGTSAEMWTMVLAMIQRRVSPEELARIAGMEVPVSDDLADIAANYDVALYFDVKDLDMEFVWKKIEAFMKWVAPSDKNGTLDWSAFTKIISQAIDPTWSATLIQGKAAASQALFNSVRDQMALMYNGNPPDLVEMDPTAETQLNFAKQIIYGDAEGQGGNLEYQAALSPTQPDGSPNDKFKPLFAQHLETWEKNRSQSVKQDINRPTGRLGVNPMLGSGT